MNFIDNVQFITYISCQYIHQPWGATAADCAAAFKADGTGAIVNASRSVIYAGGGEQYAATNWQEAVEAAARAFAEDISRALKQMGA